MNDNWGYNYNYERFIITCCKDCPNRYPGCHDHCGKYQSQKKQYEEMKAKQPQRCIISPNDFEIFKNRPRKRKEKY